MDRREFRACAIKVARALSSFLQLRLRLRFTVTASPCEKITKKGNSTNTMSHDTNRALALFTVL
jgi:hypothetical protein